MNPESPRTPREEIEMRITALLMGELRPGEAAVLENQVAADAELTALHARLRRATELLREASAIHGQPTPQQPAQLSTERRARLLAHFKGGAHAAPVAVIVKPKRDWKWAVPLGLAASLMALIGGAMFVNGFALRKESRFARGTVLLSDSDTDGFSNREEWRGRTANGKGTARSDGNVNQAALVLGTVDELHYASRGLADSAAPTANSPIRGVAGADKDANGRAWKSQPGAGGALPSLRTGFVSEKLYGYIPRLAAKDATKTDSEIDKSRLALTANSGSPELNLFGRPRTSNWPAAPVASPEPPRPDVAAAAPTPKPPGAGAVYLPATTAEAPALDFFTMPIVSAGGAGEIGPRSDGYTISEVYSAGGKVNITSQLMPFGYIKRTETLHAALGKEPGSKEAPAPAGTNAVTNKSDRGGKAADFDTGIGRFPDGTFAGKADAGNAQPQFFTDLNQPVGTRQNSAAVADADKASAKLGGTYFSKPDKERPDANSAYYAGSFWDTPRVQTYFDRGSNVPPEGYRGGVSSSQPAQNEFQKYPGHPSTTSLGLVLPNLLPKSEAAGGDLAEIVSGTKNATDKPSVGRSAPTGLPVLGDSNARSNSELRPPDSIGPVRIDYGMPISETPKSNAGKFQFKEGYKYGGPGDSSNGDDTSKLNINHGNPLPAALAGERAVAQPGESASKNVDWMYLTEDGRVTKNAPVSGKPGDPKSDGERNGEGDKVVGRIAFWNDDDTAKVNVATAGGFVLPQEQPPVISPDGANKSAPFAGVISGSGDVTLSGTGVSQLNKTNAFTGGITLNGGTLQLTPTTPSQPAKGGGAGNFNYSAATDAPEFPKKPDEQTVDVVNQTSTASTFKLNVPNPEPKTAGNRHGALGIDLKGGTTFNVEIHRSLEGAVAGKADEGIQPSNEPHNSTEAAANRELGRRISRETADSMETDKGRSSLQSKDYEAAFSHFKNAAENIPAGAPASEESRKSAVNGLAEAGVKLAEQRAAEGYYASAAQTLQEVLKKNPDSKSAQRLLSQIEAPDYFNKQTTPQHRQKSAEASKNTQTAEGFELTRNLKDDVIRFSSTIGDPSDPKRQGQFIFDREDRNAAKRLPTAEGDKFALEKKKLADVEAKFTEISQSHVKELDFGWLNANPKAPELEKKRNELNVSAREQQLKHLELKPMEKKLEELRDVEPDAPKPAPNPLIPQPEIRTGENAFSTFSLNVSDVAFKLAAASLERGAMPDVSTLRTEEFINAFDYRDPEAAPGAPLAFASERARYPFAQNRDLLRLSVKTAAAGRQAGKPLNIVLLLDNSGSMERADRVRIVREGLRTLSVQLQPQDKLSIVTFSRTPRLWADGVAGDKAAEATARAGEITPEGGTNLAAALDLGYKTALRHYQVGSINHVVLLTDGAANLGDVDPAALKQKVEAHRKQGIALDCFGIGWEGLNDDMLEQLSRNGDGRYGFINTPEEAATNFAGQLAGALRVAASDVKVQVEWNPKRVTAYRQVGYAKHQLTKEQFRDNTVDAAELAAAESGNALYVIEVNPRGEGDLATVRVRFKVPGTSDYREHEWAVPFARPAAPLEQSSSTLRLAASAAAFSEMLAGSPYATEVTSDRLLQLVNGLPAIYGADPRPQKLEWMIRQAKSLSGR